MLKFLSMRAVAMSAGMVLSVGGVALAASQAIEEQPIEPRPVIADAAVAEAETTFEVGIESESTAESKTSTVEADPLTGPELVIPLEENGIECQAGNHGNTVSHIARHRPEGVEVRAAAQSDCGKKHQDEEPPISGDEGTGAALADAGESQVLVVVEGEVEAGVAVTEESAAESDGDKAEVDGGNPNNGEAPGKKSSAGSNGHGQGKDKKNK